LLLAALVAGGTLAGAQSPSAGDSPHLLVVPHDPEGEAALARSDARVIARYREFTLVEAAGGDDTRLRRAGADRRDDMREVSLPSADFDPRSDRASLAAKGTPEPDEALAVVQFVGPVKDAWLDRLEGTGARVVQYASQNAYLVHASGPEVDRLAGLVGTDSAVRAVTPVAPRDKVDDTLTSGDVRTMAVQTIAGDPGAAARQEATSAGPRVRGESSVGELRTQFVRIDGAEAAALASDPGVVSITPWSPPRLLDERASQIVAGNLLPGGALSGPGYLDWLASEGFGAGTFVHTIDVTDQGFDNGIDPPQHPDFYVNGLAPGTDRVSYADNWTGDPDARDCGGHGTNVASIAAGFGTAGADRQDGAGFRYGMGVSPRARIGASKVFTCSGDFGLNPSDTFSDVASGAYAQGARISNNSWGFRDFGEYSVDSQEYDALVRDAQPGVGGNQQMVEIFAAGNDGEGIGGSANEGYGSVGSPATAKNVITVGASESVRSIGGTDGCGVTDAEADDPADIIDFSSRGPTDDGRLKPDLVAPGTHVTGARPQHPGYTGAASCNPIFAGVYSLLSGTSQAVPEVAGAASLIRDWYAREHGDLISPALTKAILANTATDIAGGDSGKGAPIEGAPNTDQGWGRVNVGDVLDSPPREYLDQNPLLTATGQSDLHSYQAQDQNQPVRVTLAWSDAPGTVGGNALVNDLDLVVEAGGRTYKGNVFAGGSSIPGGSADPRNNVESVFLPAGVGRFAVRVVAANIAGDGVPDNGVPGSGDATDQDFALVVSNAAEQPLPVLVHQTTSIVDPAAAGGDGDGVLESDEPFRLTEGLRNAGDAPASSVSGTLSGSGIIPSPGSATWGNLAAGATGTNTPPLAGRLSPGVSCGADVTATLELTTGQGPQSVPVTLPTGVVQAPTLATSTAPAAPIPDDSAAGVASAIEVTNAGRIKDLDVRINSITHPWVGDVRIDVTGPDGTTVTLAEHPGGPDNGGDNFTNTVFNDEAGANISAGTPPYTGNFRPQNDQLSRFDGKRQQGTWTLRVRDLFEGLTGTLHSWGTQTSRAACDFDGTAPETTIDDPKPPNPSDSPAATFAFSSNEDGAGFECRLDSGAYVECGTPKSYSGLADGVHTFSVRAVDGTGNVDTSPASYSWQVDTPPETTIDSGPSGLVNVRNATFGVSSDEPNVAFECQLDGGSFGACGSPATFAGLADGEHTFRVRARDAGGHVDDSPAQRTWTIDATAPAISVTSPEAGSVLTDTTPTLAGRAGTSNGDAGTATVKLYSGRGAAGTPVQTLIVPRDASSGAWSRDVAPLTEGTYTVRAEQSDVAGNAGASAPLTFSVDTSAPHFALAPTEEYFTDALARGLTVLAGCASSCKVSATLTIPATKARSLGLRSRGRRASASARGVTLASRTARLGAGDSGAVTLRLSRAAKAALRGESSLRARLGFKISVGGRTVLLRQPLTLGQAVGLRRIVGSGLRLGGVCSEPCTLTGNLELSRRDARRVGLKAPGSGPVTVADGEARAGSSAARLILKFRSAYRRALLRVRGSLKPTLEASVRGDTGPEERATRRLVLRR
jgi:subtilisin-like proprotein convertase family protein